MLSKREVVLLDAASRIYASYGYGAQTPEGVVMAVTDAKALLDEVVAQEKANRPTPEAARV